ncbi:hypothetical protein H0H81_001582 [Sphagnurus paluster]|uniref:Uncharacterized protein n=1 Tax=Sphagnurus paluster TaxID=117069 RepID=A0A9P7G241_9AGAR|nr:hypothetical protein H0H81_001582 [Sphagnurus paluster]
MSSLLSSLRTMFVRSEPEKLQRAQRRAEEAIQKVHETGDPEVAAFLAAQFEDLKARQQRLPQSQGCSGREEEESEMEDVSEAKDAGVPYEDLAKSIKCTFLSESHTDPTEIPLEFTIKLPPVSEGHMADSIVAMSDQLIAAGMNTIDEHQDNLIDLQVYHLSDMYDRLAANKEKVVCVKAPAVAQVAAQLYFSDALRFLWTAHSMAFQKDDTDELEQVLESDEPLERESSPPSRSVTL